MALILAAAAWFVSALLALLGLVVLGLRCDESCGGEGWRRTEQAWQWYALSLVALVPVVAASDSPDLVGT